MFLLSKCQLVRDSTIQTHTLAPDGDIERRSKAIGYVFRHRLHYESRSYAQQAIPPLRACGLFFGRKTCNLINLKISSQRSNVIKPSTNRTCTGTACPWRFNTHLRGASASAGAPVDVGRCFQSVPLSVSCMYIALFTAMGHGKGSRQHKLSPCYCV